MAAILPNGAFGSQPVNSSGETVRPLSSGSQAANLVDGADFLLLAVLERLAPAGISIQLAKTREVALRRLHIAVLALGAAALVASCTTNTSPPSPSAPAKTAPVATPPANPAATPAPASRPSAPAPSSAPEQTPGPGAADLTVQACSSCHGMDTVTAERHDLDGWKAVVHDMIDKGASLTDAQANQVANYLAYNYGLTPPPAR